MRPFLYGILVGALLHASPTWGAPHVVVVMDTGLSAPIDGPLCAPAQPDLSEIKHGSNVAGLIAQEAGGQAGYCLLILRVFTLDEKGSLQFDTQAYLEALHKLTFNPPAIINLSFGGPTTLPLERILIASLLKKGTIIVAAAGNDGRRLVPCYYLPACLDPRIVVVGSTSPASNWGPAVDVVVNGTQRTAAGTTLSGTSQATAVFTGRLLRRLLEVK